MREPGRSSGTAFLFAGGHCEVDLFTDALFDFLEPCSWIGAVNHAAQKAEPFGCIVAVPPDVVLRDLGVQSEKGIHAPRLGEDVSRVAKLRGFNDHGFLNVENVFIPKQIDSTRPACPRVCIGGVVTGGLNSMGSGICYAN